MTDEFDVLLLHETPKPYAGPPATIGTYGKLCFAAGLVTLGVWCTAVAVNRARLSEKAEGRGR